MKKKELRDVFFWSDEIDPNKYVHNDIPAKKKIALVKVLEAGKVGDRYRGWATCRIKGCKQHLGSTDMIGHGFRWPARCAHYITEHDVWPPGADELLAAAGESGGDE